MKHSRYALVTLVAALASGSCGPHLRRFPLAAPLTRDDDTRPVHRVARYHSSDAWDFADQTLFSRIDDATRLRQPREAIDVNALDEVPDSSWFTNRLGARELTPSEIERGSCDTPPIDATQTWTVVSAKPNGFNPGFIIRAPDGRRYLLKADGVRQTELATAADAIASRIYYALGYFTPCNRVVSFDRRILAISPGAHAEDDHGRERPIGPDVIDRVLRQATRLPDGRYRMAASRFLDGEPLGPFTYEGIRSDDDNDVVPHEERRELRAGRLVAAWLNHYDTREQNTMTTWVADGAPRRGHVVHYMLDFGDAFGAAWPWDELTARSGHAYVFDPGMIAADFVTLGAIVRPWDRARIRADAWVFTYYDAESFDPTAWRPITPNPAFLRMTERDAAWMARRIARFDDALVHAAVQTGAFTHPEWSAYLESVLRARRRRIVERYLSRLSPLDDVTIDGDRICAVDLARRAGLRFGQRPTFSVYGGDRLAPRVEFAPAVVSGDRLCTTSVPRIASLRGLRDDDVRRYVVVDLVGAARTRAPLRLHFYDLDARGLRLVGIERPDNADAPRL
jgi:hypothetical protein